MLESQWQDLLRVLDGELLSPLPVGLIVDCPWLPGWTGEMTILDYLSSESHWFDANMKVIEEFPEMWVLPGFWSEYGMCTEPSSFGCRCTWPDDEFPFPHTMMDSLEGIDALEKPDCRTDGLPPLVIKRLQHMLPKIEAAGHKVRFATARGPLNIATYLLGHTESMMAVITDPEPMHKLMQVVTDYLVDWLRYQKECFPTIEGIFVLDDLIGFLDEATFQQFVVPYMKQLCDAIDVPVKMLHNDADGRITAKYMTEMGFNIFNFSFNHSLPEMREACGPDVVLLGNLPPRDVLAGGTADDVRTGIKAMLDSIDDHRRLIVSVGGGAPPGAPTENIVAMLEAAGLR